MFEGRSKAGGIRLKGEVRSKFIQDSNLTIHSHPVDWVSAFFPVYEKPARSKSGLLKCEGCGVSLCSWCFKPFHVLNVLNDAVKAKMCIEITDRKYQHGKKKRNVQRK